MYYLRKTMAYKIVCVLSLGLILALPIIRPMLAVADGGGGEPIVVNAQRDVNGLGINR